MKRTTIVSMASAIVLVGVVVPRPADALQPADGIVQHARSERDLRRGSEPLSKLPPMHLAGLARTGGQMRELGLATWLAPSSTAANCVVRTTTDSGAGSLRACLMQARPGDAITFDPGVFRPDRPASIKPITNLPPVLEDRVSVNASGAGVILDGADMQVFPAVGLVVADAREVSIRGLQITGFDFGIVLMDGTRNSTIGGETRLVTDPAARPFQTERPSAGNIIIGNLTDGILIQDQRTSDNRVVGNYIGVDATGSTAKPNEVSGVKLIDGPTKNVIGGESAGLRNVISGNGSFGVVILDPGLVGTADNRVVGNYIGTDATGASAVPNTLSGVRIQDRASRNTVGGSRQGERNVISGNGEGGVSIRDLATKFNAVEGNYIGLDAGGTMPVPNADFGVLIDFGAQENRVGGATAERANVVSGNTGAGIVIQGRDSDRNVVEGNLIGTDPTGSVAIPNGEEGIKLQAGASENSIGGPSRGLGNLISGNSGNGLVMHGNGTQDNNISGNNIGTNADGTAAIPNGRSGVLITFRAGPNVIGGDTGEAANLISGNTGDGVVIEDDGTEDNSVWGNLIGLDVTGRVGLPNAGAGLLVRRRASKNIIGGPRQQRNVVSGNGASGVVIESAGTSFNIVLGNRVGTDIDGLSAIPNGEAGLVIRDGAADNTVGGEGLDSANVLSGNRGDGAVVTGSGTARNALAGNLIGTDATSFAPLPNDGSGVVLSDGARENRVGPANVIDANRRDGIRLTGTATARNTLTRNRIGPNGEFAIRVGDGMPLPDPPSLRFGQAKLSGNACAGCTVELFRNPTLKSQAWEYLGSADAGSDGMFELPVVAEGVVFFTATATGLDGATSGLSRPAATRHSIMLPLTYRQH